MAALSWYLFDIQSKEYQESIVSEKEWSDAMIITNTAIDLMGNWTKAPVVKEYSVSADWDNRWRSGGTLDDVIDEAHLAAKWQLAAIVKFAKERPARLKKLKATLPE